MTEEKKRLQLTWKGKNVSFLLPVLLILAISFGLAGYAQHIGNDAYFGKRVWLYFCIGIFFYLTGPGSVIHRISMKNWKREHVILCALVLAVTCFAAVRTMEISNWWSDNGPDYHFQYEAMTEAVLDGHLYLDIEVSPELAALENPYDPWQRNEAGASYLWDHAFYDGHYYMYFGVVPVFLIMVPFKLLGISLFSYQVTQIFVVLAICGLFAVFYEICKRMCPEIPLSGYLAVSVASSWISLWYAIKYPALYCTANSGGICLAVWGFYFCYKAFVTEKNKRKVMIYTIVGAFCSALTFGTRPTIGLFCLILIPLLFHFMKNCHNFKERIKTFVAFCIPFAVVAILLMLYNYARFDSPFEFGQSYQLTTVDQHAYSENKIELHTCLTGLWFQLFSYEDVSNTFPYIHHDGNLVLFPILYISLRSFGLRGNGRRGQTMVKGLVGMICLSVVIISAYHVTWAPVMFRRYSLDFNFLLCFLLMLGVCGLYWQQKDSARLSYLLTLLAAAVFAVCFLLYFVEYDYSIATHHRDIWEKARDLIAFWEK